MDTDRPLVDAAAAGDREAFDELVRRYQGQILTLTRALLAGSADAEDVAQEVFVRAWLGLRGFRGEATFRGWLYRIAINAVYSHQRKASRERRLFQTDQRGATLADRARLDLFGLRERRHGRHGRYRRQEQRDAPDTPCAVYRPDQTVHSL